MDFSKIKKIFYIIAIISMLLSIKSKVLGASNLSLTLIKSGNAGIGGVTYTANLPTSLNDKHWVIQQISRSNGSFDTILYYSDDVFTITSNNDLGTFGKYVNSVALTYAGTDDTFTYDDNFTGFSNISINGTYQLNTAWLNASTFIYGNFDLYINGNLVNIEHFIPKFVYPSFDNTTEIKNGYPDGVIISPHDFTQNDDLYFHLLRIDNTVPNSDTSVYYYSDHTFLLNKDSNYYRTWLDPSIEGFYYYIPRYNLKLSTNSSYLYVLNNSSQQIQNSFGLYSVDISKGIYDVVQSDTAGVITSTEEQTDLLKNMEEQSVQNANSLNDINNTLNDNNVSSDTETDIDASLKFDNKNEGLNNLNNGFFSRLTSMLSNLLGYNLSDDTSVSLPLPNSDKSIVLHSKDIYDNVAGSLRVIINAFWTFIFTFYLWKFINKIYISVTSGNILDSFSSSGEAITNDML